MVAKDSGFRAAGLQPSFKDCVEVERMPMGGRSPRALFAETAYLVPQSHSTNWQTLPAREDYIGLPGPSDQIAMFDLPNGYHKRVRVYLGTHMAIAMLDTGSFRNCIDENVLKNLE